tara:strand:+ start:640 stop:1101 length:462 start_codon:yes stop_codon:yes gene_type:complete
MSFIELNKKEICEYQQNREPYLFIDHASKIYPGKSAEGYKDLKENEWFFEVHWPGDPNMPGMLQIEALTQMSALSILTMVGNKGEIMYLISAEKLLFKKKVLPKKRLYIKTEVIKYKRGLGSFSAVGMIENELVCSAKLNLVLPKEINKYNIK